MVPTLAFRTLCFSAVLTASAVLLASPVALAGQAASGPASGQTSGQAASSSQAGTVKAVTSGAITLTTDSKAELTVTPQDGARLLQLAPGSKDLKAATPIALTDIAPGDRILVTGRAGDTPSTVKASRIILMKAADLAGLHASQSEDWTKRGSGGIVKLVNGSEIGIAIGARSVSVSTTPSTIFRRYAGDSVKFEDARTGTLADIHAGDQLRVRGTKSPDGTTITAEEIVSGSFQNIAGVLTAVDAAAGTVSLRDLTTKKNVTIQVTANSDLRNLPAQFAQSYARSHAAGAQPASAPAAGADSSGEGRPRRQQDLSQMLGRLPTQSLTEIKPGEAVLIVASQGGGGHLTAITMLSGVEPILTATPSGAAPTLSPWSLGAGGGEGEGGGGQ